MSDSVRDTFIANIDPEFAPGVLELDRAVMAARADLQSKISYQMLTYALGGDYRHWICAIGVTSKLVCLRFLYGVLLDDPRGVLRAGSAILKTIDFPPGSAVDSQLVANYVNEAVSKLEYFKANERNL